MNDRPWYEELFGEVYLRAWASASTPDETAREVEGIIQLLGLPERASILDLCCGYGRIAIPLAQRGYQVTGLDLSETLLAKACTDASAAGVDVRWAHADMRQIPFEAEFDAVINIFTSFGYFESDDEDARVLHEVHKALRPGGLFLLDFINREWVVRHYRRHGITRLDDGGLALQETELDLRSGRNVTRFTLIEPAGERRELRYVVRTYTLAELVKMLDRAGLAIEAHYGDLDGSTYTLDSQRLVVVARKDREQ
jgi:SAM-dependent methyltransferase